MHSDMPKVIAEVWMKLDEIKLVLEGVHRRIDAGNGNSKQLLLQQVDAAIAGIDKAMDAIK